MAQAPSRTAFAQHMHDEAVRTLALFPPDEIPGIYAVTFHVDSVDQDPRFPYLAMGYNTEDAVARELAASQEDPWLVRWNYAYFPSSGLEGIRALGHDPERDPDGAALHLRETREKGLWYEEGDPEEDEFGERLDEEFRELCVQVARRLHEGGHLVAALGRPLPIVLYNMFDTEAMFALTRAANPPELVEEFLAGDLEGP
ncbi:hypothetical protein [Streptomyces sp. NPDC048172]|uniref:hypothetical protein n=1 Tax=Streptomyces sp. NPDC048172 TaxID=3365505 RepID=UPI00371E26BD